MSKALQGAALLGGAVALGAAAFFTGGAALAIPFFGNAIAALALGGISMEAGAIAGALTSNRGQNITTRQAAAFRQIIYGTQRVGGNIIYRSTTGSKHDQMNYVIVIAGHGCSAIQGLYLDGRPVHFAPGVGTTTRNSFTFGGSADGQTYSGPNGVQYNFGGKVYCEACYGDQTANPNTVPGGGYNTGLNANDPVWGPSAQGLPYVGGCTYVYLKLEYDQKTFPSEPEIRFTVEGKSDIYDPRTGTRGYSSNWALICADILTDSEFGLGDVGSVNQAQLIAAANVCDEDVALAAGGTEKRYSCHTHYDSSTGPGDSLANLMGAAAGRMSRIGGEWYLWPAYFQGATAKFDAAALTGSVQWSSTRAYRDLFNRVTGTYIAPNYPYNVSGNYYDGNGFNNGEQQDNFGYAYQPTNFPEYACDPLHGYAADEYLLADTPTLGSWNAQSVTGYKAGDIVLYSNLLYQATQDVSSQVSPDIDTTHWIRFSGNPLTKEISQPCVLSVAQAQRLAKINLLRNRQQGTGVFQMALSAYQLQPCDTFTMTFAQNGWTEKLLEVNSVAFHLDSGGSGSAPVITLEVGVNETDASVYEWSPSEELSVVDVPVATTRSSYIPVAPESLTLTSSAATAITGADGLVYPRIQVSWDTPLDCLVLQIQIQYQLTGASSWSDGGTVDVSLNSAFISGIVAGQQYDVRIRSVRSSGAASPWVEVDGCTAGLVFSILTQTGLGIGSLVGEAYSNGTAAILCDPFTAVMGNYTVSVLPASFTISGLNQAQLYYVYYQDPSFTGGAVTPIATQNKSDFLGKLGYWLIDSVVTPSALSSGGGTGGTGGSSGGRYSPTTFQDYGSRTTQSPAAAYDGDTTTAAIVGANATAAGQTAGDLLISGFPSIALSSAATLTVSVSACSFTNGSSCSLYASVNGTGSSQDCSLGSGTYSFPVPANTTLSSVTLEISADAEYQSGGTNSEATSGAQPEARETDPPQTTQTPGRASVSVAEVFIQ